MIISLNCAVTPLHSASLTKTKSSALCDSADCLKALLTRHARDVSEPFFYTPTSTSRTSLLVSMIGQSFHSNQSTANIFQTGSFYCISSFMLRYVTCAEKHRSDTCVQNQAASAKFVGKNQNAKRSRWGFASASRNNRTTKNKSEMQIAY